MRPLIVFMFVASGATAASCTDETEETVGPPVYEPNKIYEESDGIVFTTEEFEVPVGDSFTCFYTEHFTDRDLAITNALGGQLGGGHHILAYYADTPREPGYHPCADDEMVNLHQIAGSAGDGGAQSISLPDGLALAVPAGKQIVLEAHYINETSAPFKAFDWVKLIYGDPAQTKHYVNYLVTIDEGFEVPASGTLTRTTECTLDRDFQIALSLGHMHEQGSHYKLEVLDAQRNLIDTPLDNQWVPYFTSHPPLNRYEMDAPYMLRAGQILRQTCSWNNTTSDPLLFPREMCLAFMYYWPGEGDITCQSLPVEPQ